ncbi:MAG TPA: L,D-transpeptidase family protein, partial [Puia sp.]|nr:L,D-transpeptidase family protein [Puia sp.]
FRQHDEEQILDGLAASGPDRFQSWLGSLQRPSPAFDTLRAAIGRYLDSGDSRRVAQLAHTLNTFRRIRHFQFDRFIVVNIPSAGLRYYSADTLTLQMRVVAGQTSKRTPRFAAWCTGLVLYPYWNIPRRIAIKEMLPLFRRVPGLATVMDIQVLDEKGRTIDPAGIDWKTVSPADFPYTLRQAPGCENALGVLKFELNDPFDVYMHDTNLKRAFGANYRYLSHGCIRLEKASQLGNLLLDHRLDTAFLAACFKDQRPSPVPLAKPVPVFVVYLTALPDSTGRIIWLKDIYHLRH